MSDIGAETATLLTQRDATAGEQTGSLFRDASKETPDQAQSALAKETLTKIARWKKHHEEAFKRMKEDTRFASNKNGAQWGGTKAAPAVEEYVANITFRHIQQRTGVLYAKNPRVKASRRRRIDYRDWDGTPQQLEQANMAMQAAQAAMMGPQPVSGPDGTVGIAPPPPMPPPVDIVGAQAVIADAMRVKQHRQKLDRVGKTAEILYEYFMDEGNPSFKKRAKAWVRRTLTCGVGWVKLDFERVRDYTPNVSDDINSTKIQLDRLSSELDKMAEDQISEGEAAVAMVKAQLEALQQQKSLLVREGLVFSFPKSWRVIPDDTCSQLTGLVDCWEMAEEMPMSPDEIREAYKIDIKNKFTRYEGKDKNGRDRLEAMVYEHYDRRTGLMSVVCEGYDDFLVPPQKPRVSVNRFFPYYPLAFNEMECEDGEIFPPSDVQIMWHMQKEYNRSREALRQHRIASQPGHVANKALFSNEQDVEKMRNRQPHEVVMLEGLGDKPLKDALMAIPLNSIDPNIYEVNQTFVDVQRTTGDQAAVLGGTADSTATESSIAENSRLSTVSSNADDLDMVLTELARDGSHVMLCEVSQEQAIRLAGDGAVWPATTGEDYSAEIYLEVVAGSSGRPNRDRDAAIVERLFPLAVQTGAIKPEYLARKVVQLMDETVDMEDAILEGLPSILAINAMAKAATPMGAPGGGDTPTGNPATDPTQQGAAQAGPGAPMSGGPGTSFPAPNAAPAGLP